MTFTTYTREQFVEQWINAYAAELGITPNLQPGKAGLAIADAQSGASITLQFDAQQVLDVSRAQTSEGDDLTSFYMQFGFPRNVASKAQGSVTFTTTNPPLSPILIPAGTVVATPDGKTEYVVIADPAQPGWSAADNAYVINVGETNVNATVQATAAGTAFNVQDGALSILVGTIFGITTVANALPILNGNDIESDASYTVRWLEYLGSLSKGTKEAIAESVQEISTIVKYNLRQNVKAIGNPPTGEFPYDGNIIAYISDGTGNPSAALLAAAYAAVRDTIAYGLQFQILPCAARRPHIQFNIRLGPNGLLSLSGPLAVTAVVNYAASINPGDILYPSEIERVAKEADPSNIISIEPLSCTIDGIIGDLQLNPWEELLVDASNISVSTY